MFSTSAEDSAAAAAVAVAAVAVVAAAAAEDDPAAAADKEEPLLWVSVAAPAGAAFAAVAPVLKSFVDAVVAASDL